MGTFTEDRNRERLSNLSFVLSFISLLPFLGGFIAILNLIYATLLLALSKQFPSKIGGLTRLRISILISFLSIGLSLFEFDSFFKFKLKEAEEMKYKITLMRAYSASEALEEFYSKKGNYPEGDSLEEIEKQLDRENITHLPFVDGWGNPFTIKSRMWDYKIEVKIPIKGKENEPIVIRAKKRMPVYPYVISQEEFSKLLLD